MLIVFKSSASGNVIMLEKNGRELLATLGKDADEPKGIVTIEQLPGAIAALKSAMEMDKASPRARAVKGAKAGAGSDDGVRLHRRALPLLELLERSGEDSVPVTWGV